MHGLLNEFMALTVHSPSPLADGHCAYYPASRKALPFPNKNVHHLTGGSPHTIILQQQPEKSTSRESRPSTDTVNPEQVHWTTQESDCTCNGPDEGLHVLFGKQIHGSSIVLLAQDGHDQVALRLIQEIVHCNAKPAVQSCLCMLKACSLIRARALTDGRRLHGYIIASNFESNLFVGSSLMDMYLKCGSIEDACLLFERLPKRSSVTWNTLISGHVFAGYFHDALAVYEQMQVQGVVPTKITFLSVIKACCESGLLETGRHVHVCVVECGCEIDLHVSSALIHMLVGHGCLEEAESLFERLPQKNIVTWSALIEGYARYGCSNQAFLLFGQMKQVGMDPNLVTFSCILKACTSEEHLELGKQLHADIIAFGLESNMFVRNNLIDMYGKCGHIDGAYSVFSRFPERNIVTWSTLIGGYAQHGLGQQACQIFLEMQRESLDPNQVTLVCILKACSCIGLLQQGMAVHALLIECGSTSDIVVNNALINMYAQSRMLKDAWSVFISLQNRNNISWSTLLGAFSQCGYEQDAIDLFWTMQESGVRLDHIVYTCILKACANVAAIEQGMQIHANIMQNGLDANSYVGSALVIMYAKCGSLQDAVRIFQRDTQRDVVTWSALIEAYAYHGELELALSHYEQMQVAGVKPDSIVLLNVLFACSHGGVVDIGCLHFKSMRPVHDLIPLPEHFNLLVDIFRHANFLDEAEDLLESIPFKGNTVGWTSLLSSCQIWCYIELGRRCFNHIIKMEPENAAGYTLMSYIYKFAGMEEDAEKLEHMRVLVNAWKKPGKAYLEIDNHICEFAVGDKFHHRSTDIYVKLNGLETQIRDIG